MAKSAAACQLLPLLSIVVIKDTRGSMQWAGNRPNYAYIPEQLVVYYELTLRKCTHLLMLPCFLIVSAAYGYAGGTWP